MLMNAEYITNWSEFYNDNCKTFSTTEQPFSELCNHIVTHLTFLSFQKGTLLIPVMKLFQ